MADLQQPIFKYIGATLFLLGNLFVLSSMYALGITGTYLGAYLFSQLFSDDRRLFRHLDARQSNVLPVQCPGKSDVRGISNVILWHFVLVWETYRICPVGGSFDHVCFGDGNGGPVYDKDICYER